MRIQLASSLILLLAVSSCESAKGPLSKSKTSAAPKPAACTSAASSGHMPAVQELESAGYDSFITTPGRLMVVDFHADWCGPCRRLGPVLEQVAGEFPGKVCIGRVNVDNAREIAEREGVRGIPDVRIFRDGRQVDQFVGVVDAGTIRELLRKHSEDLQVAQAAEPKRRSSE
ncbi:thioredoxin family protein [Luteolibacter soli]|uniref:Thioredoxin domain-containing protein n=1 Tax=Luteolibacter soli TaxID=3135280 RepID=A0ABU9B0X6_9BACT